MRVLLANLEALSWGRSWPEARDFSSETVRNMQVALEGVEVVIS
jgi:hypothetical protein